MSADDADTLLRFHFEDAAVRGELVRLGASLREILGQHFYPAPVARLAAVADRSKEVNCRSLLV